MHGMSMEDTGIQRHGVAELDRTLAVRRDRVLYAPTHASHGNARRNTRTS